MLNYSQWWIIVSYLFDWHKISSNENIVSSEPKTFVKQPAFDLVPNRSVSEWTLDWILQDRYEHVYTHMQYRRRYQSAPEGRSGSGDGRMDGWKRIKLSVINNAAWSPPFVVLRRNSRPHPRFARSKILTSARNDSINNASSTIALNTYPV